MKWDFEVGDFVVTKRKTVAAMRIYEILVRRQKDDLFHAATYEVGRRYSLEKELVESWPKIYMEAKFERLSKTTAKILYGRTND